MGYVCDHCNEEQAALLVTKLIDGDTYAVGGRCLPSWLDSMQEMVRADDDKAAALADEMTAHDRADDSISITPEGEAALEAARRDQETAVAAPKHSGGGKGRGRPQAARSGPHNPATASEGDPVAADAG
jgi:hypothetical protein